jgi:hypothetical protein
MCSSCGKPAFAYRLEADGTKTYVCLKHLPGGDAPNNDDQYNLQGKKNPPDESPNSN